MLPSSLQRSLNKSRLPSIFVFFILSAVHCKAVPPVQLKICPLLNNITSPIILKVFLQCLDYGVQPPVRRNNMDARSEKAGVCDTSSKTLPHTSCVSSNPLHFLRAFAFTPKLQPPITTILNCYFIFVQGSCWVVFFRNGFSSRFEGSFSWFLLGIFFFKHH